MKRWLVTLFAFLLLGAIVNVAVAWAVANAFGEKRHVRRTYDDGTVEHVSFPADLDQGWPMRALLSEVATADGGAAIVTFELTNSIELACWPLWPGFAINTVLYAGVLWLLFAAPFALRRRLVRGGRIKRGLCPKCAYPVGDSTVCTECGGPVNKSS